MPDDFRRQYAVRDESAIVQQLLDTLRAWKAPFAEPVQSYKGMWLIETLGDPALDPLTIYGDLNTAKFHLADHGFGSSFQQNSNAFRVFPKSYLAIPPQDTSDVMSGEAGVHAVGNSQYRLATGERDLLCTCVVLMVMKMLSEHAACHHN